MNLGRLWVGMSKLPLGEVWGNGGRAQLSTEPLATQWTHDLLRLQLHRHLKEVGAMTTEARVGEEMYPRPQN